MENAPIAVEMHALHRQSSCAVPGVNAELFSHSYRLHREFAFFLVVISVPWRCEIKGWRNIVGSINTGYVSMVSSSWQARSFQRRSPLRTLTVGAAKIVVSPQVP